MFPETIAFVSFTTETAFGFCSSVFLERPNDLFEKEKRRIKKDSNKTISLKRIVFSLSNFT